MKFKEVFLTEGLVFLKNSKRINKYIKTINKKAKKLGNEEINIFIKKLTNLAKKFYELEKQYEVGIDREKVKEKYNLLKNQNEEIIQELNNRTLRAALITIGIIGGVIAILRTIDLSIQSHDGKKYFGLEDLIHKIMGDDKQQSETKLAKGVVQPGELPKMPNKIEANITPPSISEIRSFVIRMAKKEDIDPILVQALIKYESGFDPAAVGKNIKNGVIVSRDVGLMQLNSTYYEEFKRRFNNGKDFDPTNYRDNARVGIKMLKFYLNRYDGDIDKALTAYNAGMTAVANNEVRPSTIAYIAKIKKEMAILAAVAGKSKE